MQSIAKVTPQADDQKVKIEYSFDSEDPYYIQMDSDQVYQVFLNLTQNAFHAMESLETSKKITYQVHRLDQKISFEISDQGSGISKETMAHLFEPFFSTKGVGKGSGLGLSLCYGIIAQHGGTIEVESEPMKGATFRILLPSSNTA